MAQVVPDLTYVSYSLKNEDGRNYREKSSLFSSFPSPPPSAIEVSGEEISRLCNDLRSSRICQTMQAVEISHLQKELYVHRMKNLEQSLEISRLKSDLGIMGATQIEKNAEVHNLRLELDCAGDTQTELGAELAILRGELQSAGEAQSELSKEINRLKSIIYFSKCFDNSNGVGMTSNFETGANIHTDVNCIPILQTVQLEDYSIKYLQLELKNELRKGTVCADSDLLSPPDNYVGCRQFYQSGFCHFGRGKRLCPNENSHFCLQCGRSHGTAPHLILLRRVKRQTLNLIKSGPNANGGSN